MSDVPLKIRFVSLSLISHHIQLKSASTFCTHTNQSATKIIHPTSRQLATECFWPFLDSWIPGAEGSSVLKNHKTQLIRS